MAGSNSEFWCNDLMYIEIDRYTTIHRSMYRVAKNNHWFCFSTIACLVCYEKDQVILHVYFMITISQISDAKMEG